MIAVGFQGRPRVGLFYSKQFPVETRLAASPAIAPRPRDGATPFSKHGPPSGYLSTVTPVILSAFSTCPILASPTTEPGRRGWKRRLGSPLSAPHFFCLALLCVFPVRLCAPMAKPFLPRQTEPRLNPTEN